MSMNISANNNVRFKAQQSASTPPAISNDWKRPATQEDLIAKHTSNSPATTVLPKKKSNAGKIILGILLSAGAVVGTGALILNQYRKKAFDGKITKAMEETAEKLKNDIKIDNKPNPTTLEILNEASKSAQHKSIHNEAFDDYEKYLKKEDSLLKQIGKTIDDFMAKHISK